MQQVRHFLKELWQDERGQGKVEHSFIMAFVAAVILGICNFMGRS
ncbi:MAG: hypothetical protein ACOX7L_00485 [Dethiobacteria bacterium]|jgi:Flp pilus assembly pilin Flp